MSSLLQPGARSATRAAPAGLARRARSSAGLEEPVFRAFYGKQLLKIHRPPPRQSDVPQARPQSRSGTCAERRYRLEPDYLDAYHVTDVVTRAGCWARPPTTRDGSSLLFQRVDEIRDLRMQFEQNGDMDLTSFDHCKFIAIGIGYREIPVLPLLVAFQVVGVNLIAVILIRPGALECVIAVAIRVASGRNRNPIPGALRSWLAGPRSDGRHPGWRR